MKRFRSKTEFSARGLVAVLAVMLACPATAVLHDRGGGLIYDDVLDVTWLQDVNHAKTGGYDADGRFTWDNAMTWAAGLSYYDSVREVTWSDWRLPRALPVNGIDYNDTFSFDGSTDNGYNITSTASELSYMFYVNLGIPAYVDAQGNWPVPDFGFKGSLSGPFVQMLGASTFPYWTGTEYPPFDGMAYVVVFKTGSQHGAVKDSELLAWAVRDGDVAVIPSPAPAFTVASPPAGATLTGSVTLRADPLNGNVRTMTFTIGGQVACGVSQSPYQCVWDSRRLSNGSYLLRAVAIGYDGAQTVKEVGVKVMN